MRRCVLTLLVLSLAVVAAADSEPITIGERVTINSTIMGEEREILVSIPDGYELSSESYPVLYMTDGAAHFLHTRGTVDFLVSNQLMPDVIIVAVANTDRNRDLTPTRSALSTQNGDVREMPTSGGSDVFLDFFAKELFPFVDSHYRTLPLRLFSGHSFGGLFAVNTFLTRPDMFRAVLAVSPSLSWDDDLMIRRAETFFKDRKELNSTLFVTMANEEEEHPSPTRLDRLRTILKNAEVKGFNWQILHMPEETHGSVVLRSHYWGLRKVFESWQLPVTPEEDGFVRTVEEIDAHYAELSNRFGVPVVPSEQVLNLAGYGVLGTGDHINAIKIFRHNVKLHPDSANVYDSLAEALENAERLEEALANYNRAVDNAKKNNDPLLGIFRVNRDRAMELLNKSELN